MRIGITIMPLLAIINSRPSWIVKHIMLVGAGSKISALTYSADVPQRFLAVLSWEGSDRSDLRRLSEGRDAC